MYLISTTLANMVKHVNIRHGLYVSAVVAAATLMSSCGKKDDAAAAAAAAAAAQQAPQLKVEAVTPTTSTLLKKFPATLEGKTDIQVRPQVSGFLTSVNVDEGASVKKGQVLFTIDQVQFQAAVEQAQAAVAAAKTAVDNAKIVESQNKLLYDKGIISSIVWQQSDNALKQAQAQLNQANAALVSARKNLEYTVVTAPSDGIVGKIPFRVGSLVSPSMAEPLTTVSDISQMYAYFSLTEKDLLDMTKGGSTTVGQGIAAMPEVKLILANGTEYPYAGKVETISGVVDKTTGAARVRALFPNPNHELLSGFTGTVAVPQTYENAMVIPQRATFEYQNLKFVFAVGDSSKVHMTPIQVAELNDGQNYIVTGGLQPGQEIVVEGVGTAITARDEGKSIEAVKAQN